MAELYVPVPGGRLAVHDFGSGPAVVLLHAGIVDSWAWEPLTPFLLQAGYRVVAFDRRGTGGSTTEDVEFSHRADTIAVLDAGSVVAMGSVEQVVTESVLREVFEPTLRVLHIDGQPVVVSLRSERDHDDR